MTLDQEIKIAHAIKLLQESGAIFVCVYGFPGDTDAFVEGVEEIKHATSTATDYLENNQDELHGCYLAAESSLGAVNAAVMLLSEDSLTRWRDKAESADQDSIPESNKPF